MDQKDLKSEENNKEEGFLAESNLRASPTRRVNRVPGGAGMERLIIPNNKDNPEKEVEDIEPKTPNDMESGDLDFDNL
ncbi:MAG: hypothetical protein V7K77_10695 [Nostoc sp.]|uniref:hypothetical protein n=1 Tax=Nostoc sp. TaxID=1180 RepID=UPI002FFD24C2